MGGREWEGFGILGFRVGVFGFRVWGLGFRGRDFGSRLGCWSLGDRSGTFWRRVGGLGVWSGVARASGQGLGCLGFRV